MRTELAKNKGIYLEKSTLKNLEKTLKIQASCAIISCNYTPNWQDVKADSPKAAPDQNGRERRRIFAKGKSRGAEPPKLCKIVTESCKITDIIRFTRYTEE